MKGYSLSDEAREDVRSIRDYLVETAGRERARKALAEITAGFRFREWDMHERT